MIIAIDGPAGAGKSTLAKSLSRALGILYLDTGATYRAAALYAIENNIDFNDEKACDEMLGNCEIDLQISDSGEVIVYLNGRDVTTRIRTNDVSQAASIISTYPEVRRELVRLQHRIAAGQDVVAEGRDIGSVVFPNADLKIYLDAPIDQRANRRKPDFADNEKSSSIEEIKKEISERDQRDMTREDSPLVRPQEAVYLDNGGNTVEQTLEQALEIISAKLGVEPEIDY